MNTLADRIVERMSDLNLVQEEVVVRLKKYGVTVSQPAFHKWKTGETKRPKYLVELSFALECNLEWLRTGVGCKTSDDAFASESNINDVTLDDQIDLSGLISVATPNTKKLLEELSIAIDSGQITEDEMNDLMAIAKRLIDKKHL